MSEYNEYSFSDTDQGWLSNPHHWVCGANAIILLLQSELDKWKIGSEAGPEDVFTTLL